VRAALATVLVLVAGVASAQPGTRAKDPSRPPPGWRPPTIDMDAMDIGGEVREAQVLFMLERAFRELDRASLPRRSFIPELVRTLDEEAL
jgi:hypothetical protein